MCVPVSLAARNLTSMSVCISKGMFLKSRYRGRGVLAREPAYVAVDRGGRTTLFCIACLVLLGERIAWVEDCGMRECVKGEG